MLPRILNLDPQIVFMSLVLLCQVRRVLEIARLSTHADGSIEVKGQLIGLTRSLTLDETVQARYVLQLRICVEKESGVVGIRATLSMQLLEVCHQVVYPLSVQKLQRRWSVQFP